MIIEHVPLDWISAGCPRDIHEALVRVRVEYGNFNIASRTGELVVHRAIAAEVIELFRIMFQRQFAIDTIAPAHVFDFRVGALRANNITSAFNFPYIDATQRVPWQGRGLAVDINPRDNPMTRWGRVYPPGAVYCPGKPGVLDATHFVVQAFKEHGWEWGGDGDEPFNPHHFQKPLPEYTR